MKTLFFAALCCLCFFTLAAQEKIRVPAGKDFSEALNSYGIYRFPVFTNSKIYFRNGNITSAQLNYNLVLSEVQFINPPKDTLSIGNPEEIHYMQIDTALFYYDKLYLEVISGRADEVKLAQWQQIKIEFEQLGAFDRPANGVDVQSYRNIKSSSSINSKDFIANQNRIITRESKYFLIDKFGKSFSANKAAFYNLFSEHKSKVQDYMKSEDIHFQRPEDLKKLYKFCMEL